MPRRVLIIYRNGLPYMAQWSKSTIYQDYEFSLFSLSLEKFLGVQFYGLGSPNLGLNFESNYFLR